MKEAGRVLVNPARSPGFLPDPPPHGPCTAPRRCRASRARRCRSCSTAAPTCPASGIVPLVPLMRRSRQRRRHGVVEYRRTWMPSGLAKLAPAASARGKDLGPCGDEVSGHGGARQHGGVRRDGCGVRPALLRYGARTAMRHLASRCGAEAGWYILNRRDETNGKSGRCRGSYEQRPSFSHSVLCRVRGAGRGRRRQRLSVV